MTTIYNIQLSGSSKDLYAESVAFFSWADIDWDGAYDLAKITHIYSDLSVHAIHVWQVTSFPTSASRSVSATGCSYA